MYSFAVTASSIKKKIITLILLALNVGTFIVVNVYLGQLYLLQLAQNNLLISLGEYYRLFTSMFVHADIYHLLSNMVFLVIFGLLVENKYSVIQYLSIYIFSGLIGNIVSYFVLPREIFSLGASGCIFGVLGAYYVSFTEYDRSMILYAIVSSLVMVGLSIGTTVNSWAHLFGAIGGLFLGWIFTLYKRKKKNKTKTDYYDGNQFSYTDMENIEDDDEEIEDY
ncbi:MAG: rhomboid family intramembrane serine protease [Candidatus Lokiarchaeota archaeon]|nr:rhomboid family intramembrane serine protease [Candidatus Lokiarchaeota archaeon]